LLPLDPPDNAMFTDINSEDRLVQKTFADYLAGTLGWESVYAWNDETFGAGGNLGRDSERDVVLKRDLREALARLNPNLPESARDVPETPESQARIASLRKRIAELNQEARKGSESVQESRQEASHSVGAQPLPPEQTPAG
jgi:hypothetical protein